MFLLLNPKRYSTIIGNLISELLSARFRSIHYFNFLNILITVFHICFHHIFINFQKYADCLKFQFLRYRENLNIINDAAIILNCAVPCTISEYNTTSRP